MCVSTMKDYLNVCFYEIWKKKTNLKVLECYLDESDILYSYSQWKMQRIMNEATNIETIKSEAMS
jgi:hypothetical protein